MRCMRKANDFQLNERLFVGVRIPLLCPLGAQSPDRSRNQRNQRSLVQGRALHSPVLLRRFSRRSKELEFYACWLQCACMPVVKHAGVMRRAHQPLKGLLV